MQRVSLLALVAERTEIAFLSRVSKRLIESLSDSGLGALTYPSFTVGPSRVGGGQLSIAYHELLFGGDTRRR